MTDEFGERFFPVYGREFLARGGTWFCELNGPVDVSGVDRRVFSLRFVLVKPDPRRKRRPAKERKLELRTRLTTFHNLDGKGVGYAGWLALVIEGFLDFNKTEDVIEAYEIERG
jgi:hypothetical protein